MPAGNIEIVRRVYEALARGELTGPPELLAAEVEYVNPADAVEPGTRRGLSEFAAAVAETYAGWDTWKMHPEQFEARGDRVAVLVRYEARGRGSGVEVEGRESALWTVRDGRVARYEWFHGAADAFDALGAEDAPEPS